MCRVLIAVGVILLFAGAYCYVRKGSIDVSAEIQIFIAIILTITVITAYGSYLSFQKLNQPFCAVKMVRADVVKMATLIPKPREDVVIELAAVFKNFGKYIAKNVSYEWEVDTIKNFEPNGQQPVKPEFWRKGKSWDVFTMLPEQKLDNFLIQIGKDDFNKLTDGYKSGLVLKVVLRYQDADEKMQQYSCSYLITRLKSALQEKPEVTIYKSNFESVIADKSTQKR